jgi:hypothetical protein
MLLSNDSRLPRLIIIIIIPSARCASAANAISRDVGTFNGRSVSINELLIMLIIRTKICYVHVRVHGSLLHSLSCSYAVPVTGLLVVVSAN